MNNTSENQTLENILELLENEKNKLNALIEKYEQDTQDLKKSLEYMHNEIDAYMESQNQIVAQNIAEYENIEERFRALEEENISLKAKIEQLKSENEILQIEVRDLNQEICLRDELAKNTAINNLNKESRAENQRDFSDLKIAPIIDTDENNAESIAQNIDENISKQISPQEQGSNEESKVEVETEVEKAEPKAEVQPIIKIKRDTEERHKKIEL